MIYARGQLLKSNFGLTTKIRFLISSLILTIGSKLFDIVGCSYINVGKGLRLYGFNMSFIAGLFHENRIQNEYYFDTANPSPVIIDAGSNIGDSMLYFKYLYPESIIYCFEPDQKTFEYLKKNVNNNRLENIFIYNAAIGKENGIIEFYYDEHPSYTHSMQSGRMSKNKKQIECLGIIDVLKDKKIDLLKLDIEGSETEVLECIDKNSCFSNIDQIILEYHHNIEGSKSKLGYFLSILEKNGFQYQIQSNCFPLNIKNKYQDVHIFAYR